MARQSDDPAAIAARLNSQIVETVPVDALKPYPGHARMHPKAQIQKLGKLIQRFGLVVPILVDAAGVIVDGHAVLEAAKSIGLSEVKVIRVEHLTPAEIRALRMALNRSAEDARWDRENLASELSFLLDEHIDLSLTAFEIPEIDIVLDEHAVSEAAGAGREDHLPDDGRGEPPICRAGDLWNMGRHMFLVGDALDAKSYEKLLGDDRAAMMISDPPYNVAVRDVVGKGQIQHPEFSMAFGEMTSAEFTDFLTRFLRHSARHCVDGALAYVFGDYAHLAENVAAMSAVCGPLVALCIWDKLNPGMGGLYRNQYELVFVGRVGTAPITNNVQLGRLGRNRSNVWAYRGLAGFSKGRLETLAMHPTVKPVALVADAILDVTRRGDIVLDPFAGSGTTVIAAEKTGRRARVIEIDPHYADVAIKRWQTYAGKHAVDAGTGLSFEETAERRAADPGSPSSQPDHREG